MTYIMELARFFISRPPTPPDMAGPGYSLPLRGRTMAPSVTHGPWSTHAYNCKCNVCR